MNEAKFLAWRHFCVTPASLFFFVTMTSSLNEPPLHHETTNEQCCDAKSCIPVITLDSPESDHCDPSASQCISISDSRCIRLAYAESPAPLPEDTPDTDTLDVIRKLAAEFVGTGLLVMIVVASGISAESLTDDVGIQLLINAVATMAGLYGLITIFGPVSGANFNPIVSMVDVFYKDMTVNNSRHVLYFSNYRSNRWMYSCQCHV